MWDVSTEICIMMASDYGIRHLIANFEELIAVNLASPHFNRTVHNFNIGTTSVLINGHE